MNNDKIILSSILEQRKKETAPELSEAKFFELFCASEILKDYELSYDEINSGNIGGGSDGGIDSLYLLLNDELVQEDTDVEALSKKRKNEIEIYIIQSKRTDGFSEEAINKFNSSVEELFDLSRSLASLSKTYNNDLLTSIKKFRDIQKCIITSFPKIIFRFYYTTIGNEVHPNVIRKVDKLKQRVNDHFDSAEFFFGFLGARELLQLARREPVSTFELDYSENPISTDTGSYVCLVPLKSYFNFFVDNEGMIIKRIFDANVRDYQGSVKVNRAIQETLEKPGKEDFWFLNNGVTIISPKASASGKKLIVEDPQIVNGLQTSYEIYKYFAGLKFETGDSRKILVRVIVEQDPAARDNIVRATNSQTSIPQTSLRAADKIQRDIEDYFYHQDLYYERRKNYYKNAGKPISKIVSISYLSQAVISILLQQPDYARARPSTLIDKDEDYLRIFNENYPVPIYVICVRILKKVEDVIRANTEKFRLIRKDINNIKFHLAMRTAMVLISKSKNIKVESTLLI
jgi:AIPR protein